MISREPTLERLAIAQRVLLEPFGLDEAALARALATIGEHRIDDADLYFQSTRHEGWSLEEGIVKSGSFSIDQGVGVRAVAGEKTAFAYSRRTVRSRAAGCRPNRAHHRRGRAEQAHQGGRQAALCRQPRALCADRPDRHAGQRAEGGAAGTRREDGPRQGPARGAGHGRPGRRVRRGAGGPCRRHPRRRRAPAGARVGDRHRRAERPPRGRHRRRRRALRPGLLPGRVCCRAMSSRR